MSTLTPNLSLTKPAGSESADIAVINADLDILDNAATLAGSQTLSNKTLTSPHMTTPVVDSGGLTVTAGGLAVAAGAISLPAASVALAALAAAAWSTFTPTLTQGVGLTLSTSVGRYVQLGKLVIVQLDLVISGAGTASNALVLSGLPVNGLAPTGGYVWGHGRYFDGTTRYTVEALYNSATSVLFQSHNVGNVFGITPAVTAANTHQLAATLMYEAA